MHKIYHITIATRRYVATLDWKKYCSYVVIDQSAMWECRSAYRMMRKAGIHARDARKLVYGLVMVGRSAQTNLELMFQREPAYVI